jgi:hypothetical protein
MTAIRDGSQTELLSCFKVLVTPMYESLMVASKSGRLKVVKFSVKLVPQLVLTLVMRLPQKW